MKKSKVLLAVSAVLMLSLTACGKDKPAEETTAVETTAETEKETETETVAETETETASENETESETAEPSVTYGVYESSETQTDANGEYELVTFIGEDGNAFIATISDQTEVPETFKEGIIYRVEHDEIITMSLPGIYPHVAKIEETTLVPEEGKYEKIEREPVAEIPEIADGETAETGSEETEPSK